MSPVPRTIPAPAERQRTQRVRRGPRLVVEGHVEPPPVFEQEEAAPPSFLQVCWPVILGVMLAVVAPQLHSYVVDHWGETGERMLFPFMLLFGRPELGLDEQLRIALPQLLEYLAFPIFGLYVGISLYRRMKLGVAVAHVAFVNFIAAFVLWILSRPGASHGM